MRFSPPEPRLKHHHCFLISVWRQLRSAGTVTFRIDEPRTRLQERICPEQNKSGSAAVREINRGDSGGGGSAPVASRRESTAPMCRSCQARSGSRGIIGTWSIRGRVWSMAGLGVTHDSRTTSFITRKLFCAAERWFLWKLNAARRRSIEFSEENWPTKVPPTQLYKL